MTRGANSEPAVTLADTLAWLESQGSAEGRAALDRYGITATEPFGVPVGVMRQHAKRLGTQHELALELWETGRYEARMLTTMLADAGRVTAKQADAWVRECDNWALTDTLCFGLLDRTRFAWPRISKWSRARALFVKRAGFALLWSLSTHDRTAEDRAFVEALAHVEAQAHDGRPLVKKAIDMALRAVGKRNSRLHVVALEVAGRLAEREEPAARWIGRHARRELESASVRARLARR